MSKADEIYNKLIQKIHLEGEWDTGQSVRTKYADGTPAYAKSIFGVQVVFEEGEIPLVTSKKVFTKMASKEMFLFWQQQTVKEEDFKKEGVKVWDEWFNEEGNLGKSYAYQFESRPKNEVVKIKRRLKIPPIDQPLKEIKLNDIIDVAEDENDPFIGQVIETNESGKIKVIERIPHRNTRYKIQFLNTGNVMTAYKANILKGEAQDSYRRSLNNIGYFGNYKRIKGFTERQLELLKSKWRSMLARCYNQNVDRYSSYGSLGVFVDERWHSFENYLEDIRYVPQWFLAKDDLENWELDKDYYGSNCYSKDTCVFLHKDENSMYRKQSVPFLLKKPNGKKEIYINAQHALSNRNLSRGALYNLLYDKKDEINGYSAYHLDTKEYVYRFKISKNQVVELLNNIKCNPASRRLMTSFWNYNDVNDKVLQECAWATNWNVRGDKLDLILIQRSADAGLGLIFNWIQYYLLQCLIANVSGLKVGRFIHQIGSLHYYDRHEEALLKQIKLDTYDQPEIVINKDIDDFMNYTPEDVQILNYKCGEYIKMEVAI